MAPFEAAFGQAELSPPVYPVGNSTAGRGSHPPESHPQKPPRKRGNLLDVITEVWTQFIGMSVFSDTVEGQCRALIADGTTPSSREAVEGRFTAFWFGRVFPEVHHPAMNRPTRRTSATNPAVLERDLHESQEMKNYMCERLLCLHVCFVGDLVQTIGCLGPCVI